MDILGYQALAKSIANEKGLAVTDVRKKFMTVINERIETNMVKNQIVGKKYSNSDDWLLLTDTLDKACKIIYWVLDHNSGYAGYEKIPLEIAVGVGHYNELTKYQDQDIVTEDSTIAFYKSGIVDKFRLWYKECNKRSIRSTFILYSKEAYANLNPLDRNIFTEISYNDGNSCSTFYSADVGKFLDAGRCLYFLECIGHGDTSPYRYINSIFVPPLEFDMIKNTLKEKRVVFITGSPEYGKTYAAARILWEYFQNGYEPKWFRGQEASARAEARNVLIDIGDLLKPGYILYFEDPFGRTVYETREELERQIGTIIDEITRASDVYVVITSRDEVFKFFKQEQLSDKAICDMEQRLGIEKPSYDYSKRREILLSWAEKESCRWMSNATLKNMVLSELRNGTKLPTILSIKNFALASSNVDNEDELREMIFSKSIETAREFAREIGGMTSDKKLFLAFPFISDSFTLDYVANKFRELSRKLDVKSWPFNKLLYWFLRDKVQIAFHCLDFSHPSYYEALEYVLCDSEGFATDFNETVFSPVLLNLVQTSKQPKYIAMSMGRYMGKLAVQVRDERFRALSSKPSTYPYLLDFINRHFDIISANIRDKFLSGISRKKEYAFQLIEILENHFEELPCDVKDRVLLNVSQRSSTNLPCGFGKLFQQRFLLLGQTVREKILR
ncbi:MAG: hypothetical protein QXI12_13400, partial [Candidatus Methanomethyliaceae archaeon]